MASGNTPESLATTSNSSGSLLQEKSAPIAQAADLVPMVILVRHCTPAELGAPSGNRHRAGMDKNTNSPAIGSNDGEIPIANRMDPLISLAGTLTTTRIQNFYRIDIDAYLNKSPETLENYEEILKHQLRLISEAKAIRGIPGGEQNLFIFNKFPAEIQKMVWKDAAQFNSFRQVIVVSARTTWTASFPGRLVVYFRCTHGMQNPLMKTCTGSRWAIVENSTTISQRLPGFGDRIHMNFDKDIIVLSQYTTAWSARSEGVMKGVKYIITKGSKKPWEEIKWAAGLKKMFPDLKVWFVDNPDSHKSKFLEGVMGHPGRYNMVHMPNDEFSYPNADAWPRVWAQMEADLPKKDRTVPEVEDDADFQES